MPPLPHTSPPRNNAQRTRAGRRLYVPEAVLLYQLFGSWREVAKRIRHRSGMPYTADGLQRAVRRHDLGIRR